MPRTRRTRPLSAAALVLVCGLLGAAHPAAATAPKAAASRPAAFEGRARLRWQGQQARVSLRRGGRYLLRTAAQTRVIAPQRWQAQTASPLFDALFAMAQEDLTQDSVSAITDAAFDAGKPISCHCFIAGQKWPFVWTRDVSYAIDLGLWRLDPARARQSLLFKLSAPRDSAAPPGLYVMQDTGSGGSWPVSTDRVAWFLGARHLLQDRAFADTVYRALTATLAQDRDYVFDARVGLYRGETSFLDWREQSYPAWTAHNVVFIAQSYALSTNVLHYQALQLAATLAGQRGEQAAAAIYTGLATSLRQVINERFWRPERKLYMSYIGGPLEPQPVDAYDLLGLDLAITSGVADRERAREILEHYPAWPAGSPVIWPERGDQAIYHNRAIWPFVSEYTLRAARQARDPALIALEVRSLMRGAALHASNMENYSLLEQSADVPGPLGGPVVDSPRQLWSVAAYLDMVLRGVFGLEDDGRVAPELPRSLLPMLFGQRDRILLRMGRRTLVLIRPATIHPATATLLVAGRIEHHGRTTAVELVPVAARAAPPPQGAVTALAAAPQAEPPNPASNAAALDGPWPRRWTADSRGGEYRAWLDYSNPTGPISTGITAAVKRLEVRCAGRQTQVLPVVMPHSEGWQASTQIRFAAPAGASCAFDLRPGFNMSDLAQFAHYTASFPAPHAATAPAGAPGAGAARAAANGGASGPLNEARIGALRIISVPRPASEPVSKTVPKGIDQST